MSHKENVVNPIRQFIEKVETIHEFEYGDFKRKLGLYLNNLADQIAGTQKQQVLIENMRKFVVYQSNGDIESTRLRVLQAANELLQYE